MNLELTLKIIIEYIIISIQKCLSLLTNKTFPFCMHKIVFATNNQHKLQEVRSILAGKVEIISLAETGCLDDIPETADTLEGNAAQKARYIFEKFHIDCFADDTGLEIEALNGKPGVFSARYAGEPSNSLNNMNKVLKEMEGIANRSAQFRTVIALIENGEYHYFEGIINGHLTTEAKGSSGFGYDPIFIPDGFDNTFAELSSSHKNAISHRAKAINKLSEYFKNHS